MLHALWLPEITIHQEQARNGAAFGGVSVNTMIDSIQQEDSGGGEPECAWNAYMKGRPKVDPNYAARIVAMVQPSESLL